MKYRNFGTSDIVVSALGYGAGNIGDQSLSETSAEYLLNKILDLGITLIDTARAYGLSEERIGKYLSQRRHDYVISTKVGYGIDGVEDWTYDSIIAGVEEALKKLRTDYIDIVHLHSCSTEILESGEVCDALDECIEKGKVRVGAYSGDNEPFDYAVNSNRFSGGMSSLNICDQRVIDRSLYIAKNKGMGIISKRPIANAPWRFDTKPIGHYAEEYWDRWHTMQIELDIDKTELALRFSAFIYGVDSCIVGSTNLDHIKSNIEKICKGKLPEDIINLLRDKFRASDNNWVGLI